MMFVIHSDPRDTSGFFTEEEARNAKPGHARSMGGDGFHGTVMPLQRAIRNYKAHQSAYGRYRL